MPFMKKLKKILKNILFVTVPMLLIFFILLEIISRFFFPGCKLPNNIYAEETINNVKYDIVKFNRDYGTTGLWTAGKFSQLRGRWHINNDGWNSPVDYSSVKKQGVTRIAVIGDSYIEAFTVDIEKSYPNLLHDSLGSKYEVYSFGVSGSALSQYLNVSRYVEKKYSPDIYIFNLIHNDFHESISGQSNYTMYLTFKIDNDSIFTEVHPVKPKLMHNRVPAWNLVRRLSLFRYFYYNLRIVEKFRSRKGGAKEVESGVIVNDVLDKKDSVRAITGYLLKKIKEELGNKEIIFIMDAPRFNIYKNDLAHSKLIWLNSMVGEYCKELNLPFIDLTSYMAEDYKKNGKRFETDYDGHWGEYGHQFIANVLYNYFKNKNH